VRSTSACNAPRSLISKGFRGIPQCAESVIVGVVIWDRHIDGRYPLASPTSDMLKSLASSDMGFDQTSSYKDYSAFHASPLATLGAALAGVLRRFAA
jgi:hypothetical protein